MHYYQFNIGDYRRDTQHLTPLEHGIYRLLLDQYYLSENPIDANALRLLCIRNKDDVETAYKILAEFFNEIEKGKFEHKRARNEINKYKEKSEKASNSAKSRWDANALRTQCEGNANHKPLTTNHKPLTNIKLKPIVRPPALPSKFHLFWEIWPVSQRKVSKTKCEAVWLKNNLDKIAQQIIIDVERKSKTKQWLDGYEPAPLTYLNQQRWEDGVAPDRVDKPDKQSGVSKYLDNFKDKEFKNEPIDVTPTTTRVDQESLCEIECDIWPGFNENDLG